MQDILALVRELPPRRMARWPIIRARLHPRKPSASPAEAPAPSRQHRTAYLASRPDATSGVAYRPLRARTPLWPDRCSASAITKWMWHSGAGWPGIGTALVGSQKLEDVLTAPGRNLQELAQVEERAWHGHKYLSASAL